MAGLVCIFDGFGRQAGLVESFEGDDLLWSWKRVPTKFAELALRTLVRARLRYILHRPKRKNIMHVPIRK